MLRGGGSSHAGVDSWREILTTRDGILSLVGMVPGGEDWMRGSDRLLRRAGVRKKYALAVYTIGTILWTLLLLTGLLWVKRDQLDSSLAAWSRC